MPYGATWLGLWQTSFGKMALVNNKKKPGQYIGLYSYQNSGRKVIGIVVAAPVGNHLIVKWTETKGGAGKGSARFVMLNTGTRFIGIWGRGSSYSNGGRWNGFKIKSTKKTTTPTPTPAPTPAPVQGGSSEL